MSCTHLMTRQKHIERTNRDEEDEEFLLCLDCGRKIYPKTEEEELKELEER